MPVSACISCTHHTSRSHKIISTPSFAALVVRCRIDHLPAHLASTARARDAGEGCAGEILLHGVARVALGTLVVSCSCVLPAGFSRFKWMRSNAKYALKKHVKHGNLNPQQVIQGFGKSGQCETASFEQHLLVKASFAKGSRPRVAKEWLAFVIYCQRIASHTFATLFMGRAPGKALKA